MSHTLEQEIRAWLRTARRHQDEFEAANVAYRRAARRLAQARDALEDAVAVLYRDGSVRGRNKEERDAMVRGLTATPRLELREAEDVYDTATLALEHARSAVSRDRQERRALEMRVALATRCPDPLAPEVAVTAPTAEVAERPERATHSANTEPRVTTLEPLPLFDDDLERTG